MAKKYTLLKINKNTISEETFPGEQMYNKISKENKTINKEVTKAAKDTFDYDKNQYVEEKPINKFNYVTQDQKEYHDEVEILNGLEMYIFGNTPNEMYRERALRAIEGHPTMGNAIAANAEETWGASSNDFGKNLVKRIRARIKKSDDEGSIEWNGMGDTAIPLKTVKKSDIAINESNNSITEKTEKALIYMVDKYGEDETAVKLIDRVSQTGMISSLPDSNEYGDGLNKVSELLRNKKYGDAYHIAKKIASKLEKKAMKDMGMLEADNHDINNKDFEEFEDLEKTDREIKYGLANNKENVNESKMKRLKFKNKFNGSERAISLIPESYKIDNKVFEMTDGNETYKIRWEGSLNEGTAVILTASSKEMVTEDINKMKYLYNFNSKDTLGTVKGNERLNEDDVFFSMLKTIKESKEIELVELKKIGVEEDDDSAKHEYEVKYKDIDGKEKTKEFHSYVENLNKDKEDDKKEILSKIKES